MSPIMTSIIVSSLATGTIITASSYHWLLAWIGLEINTLAIIPLISKMHHPRATEAATKYFLTQATASALILFSSTINAQQTGSWDILQLTTPQSTILLTMALALKLALAPTHFWLPEVLQGSTMMTAMIISTWQKLAPMTIIYLVADNLQTTVLLTLGITSTLVGGWAGLNQTQTRKIMAYSSIAHLGWITTISFLLKNIMLLSLTIYIVLSTSMFSTLILSNSKTIKDTMTSWTTSISLTTMSLMILLSLGGLPPLTGFAPKWLILEELIAQKLTTAASIMAAATLLSLFFYLRLTYTTALTSPPTTFSSTYKWRFRMSNLTLLITMTGPIALLILPITPMLM
uniref:NADH-ubiquinone oxidoreductase chain 2 n=1 Tax=Uranoscodon superciliosus TaxID=44144 RepID=Q71DT1_9SAUR|nr:NADH dehydrogenase subunit 2 [Uranoscodon superciliosus]